MDICLGLRSRTLEPNAMISVTRGPVSNPCSPPPSLLGFGTFNLVPVARVQLCVCLVLSRMACPAHHGWSWITGRAQLGKTLADF